MEMKYSINKLKGLFSIKKTLIYVLFILLLFIYFISASQGHSSNKLRFNFTFYFCFIQSIIAYLFTASELISYFRSGFDKLLYTYNFGIKKIIVHNFLFGCRGLKLENITSSFWVNSDFPHRHIGKIG